MKEGGAEAKRERRLGRGLAEVSHIFLSGAERQAIKPAETDDLSLWMPDSTVISITSGEAVKGKTFLAANLASGLCEKGRKVAIVNADAGKPGILDVTGATPSGSEESIMKTNEAFGSLSAADVLGGLGGRPGEAHGSGSALGVIEKAARQAQIIIIDTSPGADSSRAIWRLARLAIVITEPGTETMRASYVTIKRIHGAAPQGRVGLVVNRARSYEESEHCFRKISDVCRHFLKINLRNYGLIVHSDAVGEACGKAVPLISAFPGSKAAKCVGSILDLIVMDESAIAKRRREVTTKECELREGR
jgi:flagellar biosynthesis protein FlhG